MKTSLITILLCYLTWRYLENNNGQLWQQQFFCVNWPQPICWHVLWTLGHIPPLLFHCHSLLLLSAPTKGRWSPRNCRWHGLLLLCATVWKLNGAQTCRRKMKKFKAKLPKNHYADRNSMHYKQTCLRRSLVFLHMFSMARSRLSLGSFFPIYKTKSNYDF